MLCAAGLITGRKLPWPDWMVSLIANGIHLDPWAEVSRLSSLVLGELSIPVFFARASLTV